MRIPCPHCQQLVVQARNLSGPNYCPSCGKLFYPPPPKKVPPWILGALAVLAANLQLVGSGAFGGAGFMVH